MICQKCGKTIPDGIKFCRFCGSPQTAPAGRFCRKCGTRLNPDAKFCRTCGTPVSQNAAAAPAQSSGEPSSSKQNRSDLSGIRTAAAVTKKVAGKLISSVTADASPTAGEQSFTMLTPDQKELSAIIRLLKGGK